MSGERPSTLRTVSTLTHTRRDFVTPWAGAGLAGHTRGPRARARATALAGQWARTSMATGTGTVVAHSTATQWLRTASAKRAGRLAGDERARLADGPAGLLGLDLGLDRHQRGGGRDARFERGAGLDEDGAQRHAPAAWKSLPPAPKRSVSPRISRPNKNKRKCVLQGSKDRERSRGIGGLRGGNRGSTLRP